MFHGHHHKQHHKKQYPSWDTPNPAGYQVYATKLEPLPNELPESQQYPYSKGTINNNYGRYVTILEPKPNELPETQQYQYPYTNGSFNNDYGDYVLEDPRRIGVIESERAVVHVKANDHKVKESVDAEAEEFIKIEHKKFQISKTVKSFY